jgi:hypothetical protein
MSDPSKKVVPLDQVGLIIGYVCAGLLGGEEALARMGEIQRLTTEAVRAFATLGKPDTTEQFIEDARAEILKIIGEAPEEEPA